MEWNEGGGGKWDNCNSIINKMFFKKLFKKKPQTSAISQNFQELTENTKKYVFRVHYISNKKTHTKKQCKIKSQATTLFSLASLYFDL